MIGARSGRVTYKKHTSPRRNPITDYSKQTNKQTPNIPHSKPPRYLQQQQKIIEQETIYVTIPKGTDDNEILILL